MRVDGELGSDRVGWTGSEATENTPVPPANSPRRAPRPALDYLRAISTQPKPNICTRRA